MLEVQNKRLNNKLKKILSDIITNINNSIEQDTDV